MFILLGFLCCLVNAATPDEGVPQMVLLVPVNGGAVLQSQVILPEQGLSLLPAYCYSQDVNGSCVLNIVSSEGEEPPTKRPRVEKDGSSATFLDGCGQYSVGARKSFRTYIAMPTGEEMMAEVVNQVSDADKLRQERILHYLQSHEGRFVAESDLQKLHQQDATTLLEDVMVLIAAKHNITYEDKQYRLCSDQELPQLEDARLYGTLFNLVKDPEFCALSAAEQSYYMYAKKGVYVPVSVAALWTTMQRDRADRGAAEDRLRRLSAVVNKILRTKQILSIDDYYDKESDRSLHTTDCVTLKQSLSLYAQGREIQEYARMQVQSAVHTPMDEKYPQVLQALQTACGKPVSATYLKTLMRSTSSDHRHRNLLQTIAALRVQKHNITCSSLCGAKGSMQLFFILQKGEWDIRPECYKKALWKILNPQVDQILTIGEIFLGLSNDHYNPRYTVVEEIKRLKRFVSCEREKDTPLRKVWDLAVHDKKVQPLAYYRKKLHPQTVSQETFRTLKRYYSLYQDVQ